LRHNHPHYDERQSAATGLADELVDVLAIAVERELESAHTHRGKCGETHEIRH
jgi:hypothetical protein